MRRGPPSSTRTDTRFPYTTLCRSVRARHPVELLAGLVAERDPLIVHDAPVVRIGHFIGPAHLFRAIELPWRKPDRDVDVHAGVDPVGPLVLQLLVGARSEERRVGKECVSTCVSWCTPYRQTKKKQTTTQ